MRQPALDERTLLALWDSFSRAAPDVSGDLIQFLSTAEDANEWVVIPIATLEASPAGAVAEGRAAAVRAIVSRTLHGFVG